MKAKNIVRHPSELRRTLKAFLTFYKHLFNKESKINRSKFKSRLDSPVTRELNEKVKPKLESEITETSAGKKRAQKEPVA